MMENEEEIQKPPLVESKGATDAAAPIPIKDPFLPIPLHLETALRMTAACFVGYCLAYAGTHGYVDSIPPSLAWLIGLLGAAMATRFPVIAALPAAVILPFYTITLFSLAAATALLCAATVSDALFVACAAFFSLWVGGLRFGKTGKAMQMLAPMIVVNLGMIGLGLHHLVKDGVTVSVPRELLESISGADLEVMSDADLLGGLSQLDLDNFDPATLLARIPSSLQLIDASKLEGLAASAGLIEAAMNFVSTLVQEGYACFDFLIPDNFFSDQTVCVTFTEDRDLLVHIEGGLWLIRRLWTTTGVDNPFALFTNFLIIIAWTTVAVCTGILIPPLRTARYSLSKIALPNTLRDASWFLRRRLGEDRETMTEEDKLVAHRLVKAVGKLHGGTIAVATAFEPRILDFRFNLPRCTWLNLVHVTKEVEIAAIVALVSSVMHSPHGSTDILSVSASYEKSAKSLLLKGSNETTNETVPEEAAVDPVKQEDGSSLCAEESSIEESSRRLAKSVDGWKEAMHPTTPTSLSEAVKGIALLGGLFLGPSLLLFARLTQLIFSPILAVTGREQLEWNKFVHVVKFAIGFTAIVCMSLYSDYHDIEIAQEEYQIGIEILEGASISTFVGWNLMSYSFATMPTTEGTVKKCAFRVVGTFAGAFSAFLLLRATGDNMYGSIAWLTVTAFPAIYIMIADSDAAAIGPSDDFGYGGFYFVLTQSAIVMQYLGGAGAGDDLVVDRLVSNLLGIAMACFLAVIPPTVMGGDPKWTVLLLQETKSATEQLILGLLDADDKEATALVQLQTSHSAAFDTLKADATFLLDDAKRGSIFPFYRVDDRLESEIDQLVITSEFLRFLINRAMDAKKSEDASLFSRDKQSSNDLLNVLQSIRSISSEKEYSVTPPRQDRPVELSGDSERDLINELGLLARRIAQHESNLRSMGGNITSLPDSGDAPAKVVEHARRESIDGEVSQESQSSSPEYSA